ncbi:MAG: AMMECR1 domain-containing protein [Chloroflexi bacterium RBG_16_60_22]|nr:MAG: AMMECR1 domain-containing protein [Chloroflexi bacterium RBG_16_60_22]
MKRSPAVAGYFYPGQAEQLKETLRDLVDETAPKEDVIGLLVPHAGYQYSGPVAGATISRIKFRDTFVIMGPSHTGAGKPFSVWTEGTWQTPLGDVAIDAALARKIVEVSRHLEEDVQAHQREHAVEVQLPFLQYFKPDVRIVPIILTPAPAAIYQEIGRDIARAIKELDRDVVILASGDMTHYESQAAAKEKDYKAIEAMLALDADELTRRYEAYDISMCAHGPVVCLIAAARELGATGAELVKYQTSGDATGDYDAVVGYAGVIFKKAALHPLAALAKETVESYVREGRTPSPPASPAPEMQEQAGVFVSIHKRGALRGCIGTFEPQQVNVAAEIIANAVASATRDPRFPPVAPEELEDLDYSVDVLTSPEPVADESQLDPKKYGVIVEAGWRRGLLLPDLEGVDSVEYQIDICRQKAGIHPDEPVNLYRFEVKRYK